MRTSKTPRNVSPAPLQTEGLHDGLVSVALSPETLYSFAETFNTVFHDVDIDNQASSDSLFSDTHVLQAMSIAELMIDREAARSGTLHQTIGSANHPMVALDGAGHVIDINDSAAALFGVQHRGASFFDVVSPSAKRMLQSYLQKTARPSLETGPNFIDLIELDMKDSQTGHFVCVTPWTMHGDQHCLLIQGVNIRWPDHMTPLLKKTFGLTGSETEIFRALSEGLSVTQIAERRQTSVATVRTQVRELYSKTGTSSQLEFIRLAVSLAALKFDKNISTSARDNESESKVYRPPYPREHHWILHTLSDGRNLDYAVFGDPDGMPCLFFHSELLGDIWPVAMADYAREAGLKIIIPARPLYGRSSNYPKGSFHPTQTAHDFAELLSALHIDRVSLLAQTLGGMFALEFAALYPDYVQALVTISPMLPFSNEAQHRDMPLMHRFISTVVLRSPRMIEFIARAGYAFYLKDGPEKYLRMTFSTAPCDKAVLDHPHHFKDLARSIKFSSENGYRPYASGFKHLVKDAEAKMLALPVRMPVIIGDSDRNTRVARAESLIAKGVALDIVMAEGGGELLIFTHPELIIDTLMDAMKAG